MLNYIVRRLLQMIPILLGATLVIFLVIKMAPGDSFSGMIDPRVDPRKVEELRHRYCLDCPLPLQYINWLKETAKGNLGTSIRYKTPVIDVIKDRLGPTIALGVAAELIVFVIGVPLGILSARHKGSLLDNVVTVLAFAGISIPAFFFGLLSLKMLSLGRASPDVAAAEFGPMFLAGAILTAVVVLLRSRVRKRMIDQSVDGPHRLATILNFAVVAVPVLFLGLLFYRASVIGWLKLLPSNGYTTAGADKQGMDRVADIGRHLVLPALALGITGVAGLMRYVRSSMLEVLRQDYVRTAKAKGLGEKVVVYKHALRNALMPVITILGLDVPALVGGAIITESIFMWPGIGRLTYDALLQRDYTVLMALNLMFAFFTMLGSLLADIGYAVVDPRIRYE